MPRPRLDLVAERRDDGSIALGSPGPGRVRIDRQSGETLRPGSLLGVLWRDEIAYDLVLPSGAHGAVAAATHGWQSAAHGAELALLREASAERAEAGADASDAAPSGLFEVRAPSHGTFYARPSPNAAPYVVPGQAIEQGDTLGLVEVMKCFSPLVFPGARGVVRDVLAADGTEVQADAVLVRVELT